MPKVYLDACCVNRPFDDQTQDRIRLESEAVLLILNRLECEDDWIWVGSAALEYEIEQTPNRERRRRIQEILGFVQVNVTPDANAANRAQELQGLGFKAMDALQVACADQSTCDVLLSTDDRMLQAARRNADTLRVRVENPIDWLREVLS